jgi:hypothetical protein
MKPSQRESTKFKMEDKDFQVNTVNYYRGLAYYYFDPNEARVLYGAANGVLDENDYLHVINPLGSDEEKYKSYPAKLRNYPIIPQAILTLLGEKTKRPITKIVAALGGEINSQVKQEQFQQVLGILQQEFLAELERQGHPTTDEEGKPITNPIVAKKETSTFQNEMVKMGQDFLKYADSAYELPSKFREAFFHFLVTGKVVTYKDVRNSALIYLPIKPFEIRVVSSRNVNYLEDCECVIRDFTLPITELKEIFGDSDDLTDEILESLEQLTNTGFVNKGYQPFQNGFWFNNNVQKSDMLSNNANEIRLEHVCWTSECKIGELLQPDGTTIQVDENYEPTDFDIIEWKWVPQEWEAYSVANNRYVIGFRPIPLERAKESNPFYTKKLYNGRMFGSNVLDYQGLVKLILPYQIKTNIVHYHLEKIMNKNKDKLVLMPLGLIPEKEGMDMFASMYYADATGFLFVDETNPNALAAMQHVREIDLGLGQYIEQCYRLLQNIKAEVEDLVGVNAQRKGDVNQSAGLGVTQEAIYRGTMITEELFTEFDEFQQREYQGIMDFAPFIANDGIEATFLSSDFKPVYKKFFGKDLAQCQFGIFVTNSSSEQKKLDTYKQYAFNLSQNGASPKVIADIINADNFVEITEKMEEYEKQLQQQQQAAQQLEKDKLDLETKQHDDKMELEKYKVDKTSETSRLNKIDELAQKAMGMDLNKNNIPDDIELRKLALEERIHSDNVKLEEVNQDIAKQEISADIYKTDKQAQSKQQQTNKQ